MVVELHSLTEELIRLRKHRGVRHGALLERIGPQVRQLIGVAESDNNSTARNKLAAWIDRMVHDWPSDLRLSLLFALALHVEADQRDLGGRQYRLAQRLSCQPRTARRRVDEAFQRLVEEIGDLHPEPLTVVPTPRDGGGPGSQDGWHTRSLQSLLRLDLPAAELTEHRTIAVDADGIDEVVCQVSLPEPVGGPPGELVAEMLRGGEIRRVERPHPQHFAFHIALPRTYRRGETHEYWIRFSIPAAHPLAPHYVLQPLHRCESFDVTVRFDRRRLPSSVWRLDGVPPRMVADGRAGAGILVPDRFGELRADFSALRQGLGYGLRWIAAPVG